MTAPTARERAERLFFNLVIDPSLYPSIVSEIEKCFIAAEEAAREKAEAEVARLREALTLFRDFGCPVCHGDCSEANPPIALCPMIVAREALASPGEKGGEE